MSKRLNIKSYTSSISVLVLSALLLTSCGGGESGESKNDSEVFIILAMAEVPSEYPDSRIEFNVYFDLDGSYSDSDGDIKLRAKNGTYSPDAMSILDFDIWISEYVGEDMRWERIKTLNSENINTQGNNIIFSFPNRYLPKFNQFTPIRIKASSDNEMDTIAYSSNGYGVETNDSYDPAGFGSDPKIDLKSFTIDDSFDFAGSNTNGDSTGGNCDSVWTGLDSIGDVQPKLQCETACVYQSVGNTIGADAACAIVVDDYNAGSACTVCN